MSREADNSYKRDICHIRMFSFVLTKLNQKERRVYDMSFFLVTRLLNSRICLFRTDSKQSLRPLSFLSRTGNVSHSFHLQNFCILTFFKRTFHISPAKRFVLHRLEPQAHLSPRAYSILKSVLFTPAPSRNLKLWRTP